MIIHSPLCITPRLLPGVKIGEGWVSIEYDGWTNDGRRQYQYHVDIPGYSHSNNALSSGIVLNASLQSGLESLLTFLGAFAESVQYSERTGRESENGDMFPSELREWATENSDEFTMIQLELEESETPIIDEDN